MPADDLVVVRGADADEIERGVLLGRPRVVHCRDWHLGQEGSLRVGLAAVGLDVAAAVVLLGDEPFVSPEAAGRLLASRRGRATAVRVSYSGRPGHPVLIERGLFDRFIKRAPGTSPASLLREAGVEAVECSDLGDPADVDTPAQLAALGRSCSARPSRSLEWS